MTQNPVNQVLDADGSLAAPASVGSKRLFLCLGLFVFLGGLLFILVLLRTPCSGTVTLANMKQIQPGMNRIEVEQILGKGVPVGQATSETGVQHLSWNAGNVQAIVEFTPDGEAGQIIIIGDQGFFSDVLDKLKHLISW